MGGVSRLACKRFMVPAIGVEPTTFALGKTKPFFEAIHEIHPLVKNGEDKRRLLLAW